MWNRVNEFYNLCPSSNAPLNLNLNKVIPIYNAIAAKLRLKKRDQK